MTDVENVGIRNYFDWCRLWGFQESYDKSSEDISAEHAALLDDLKLRAEEATFDKRPGKFIKYVLEYNVAPDRIHRPFFKRFATRLKTARLADPNGDLQAFYAFIEVLEKRSGLLTETLETSAGTLDIFEALIKIFDRRGQWIRDIQDWRPKGRKTDKQFSQLCRYLFAHYDVPRFMDTVWFRQGQGTSKYRDAFIHVGAGRNIRTAKLPVSLTKKMAHFMMDAPETYTFEQALRWGQIHGYGGDERLCEAICGSRLAMDFSNEKFWAGLIRLLVDNPMVDMALVGPIIDYVYAQKFDSQTIVNAQGEVITEPPPQPGFSFKGRTLETLLQRVDAWHEALGKSNKAQGKVFERSGITPFRRAAGSQKDPKIWSIEELLSGQALILEGRRHRHCVASYAWACESGRLSIWSMRVQDNSGVKFLQTIEVTREREIVQCRGKNNRLPNLTEFNILQNWASHANLRISPWVKAER